MSEDLAAFIQARLDEDRRSAEAANADSPSPWCRGNSYGVDADAADDDCVIYDDHGDVVVYDEGSPTPPVAQLIARHDPARVLRGVEATRRIVDLHKHEEIRWEATARVTGVHADGVPERGCLVCSRRDEDGDLVLDLGKNWCSTLRLLASEWSDHPDFRPEWTV